MAVIYSEEEIRQLIAQLYASDAKDVYKRQSLFDLFNIIMQVEIIVIK